MRRGFTLVEVLVTAVLLTVAVTSLVLGMSFLGVQTEKTSRSTDQVDAAINLLETFRLELSNAVVNPMAHPSQHLGNSFLISKPNGTSIQFVTEKNENGKLARYLVYYEVVETDPAGDFDADEPAPAPEVSAVDAKDAQGPKLYLRNSGTRKLASVEPGKVRPRAAASEQQKAHLRLRKTVWRFEHPGPWFEEIKFPPGWNRDWIGKVVERVDKYQDLGLEDIRWQYFTPTDSEGRAFLRVKLVLRAHGSGVLLPFSTVISIPSPDMPVNVSDCPCLFSPCFDKNAPDCHCCSAGTK